MRPAPRLSVVVGSHNARATAAECLDALTRQCAAHEAELIVVDNSDDGTAGVIRARFPGVRLIETREHAHIPELWAVGIRASTGAVVALTTAHCVPGPGWVRGTLEAHAQAYPGIGGAIDNHPAAGWAGWAIFFCRYSQYMRPFPEATNDEIAADNASYKRWALERYREAWRHGFWEPTVHAEMRRDGYELLRTPGVVVYHKRSFTARGFVRNRFSHGRQFGRDRAAGLGG
ncbi:MAG: glycosyltransferase, partial [Rhodothermales bacterium]|nr:glycosyltransferase [Rhodothermales bacterium]